MNLAHSGQLKVRTSNGFELSVGGDELVRFDSPEITVRQYKRITLYTNADCIVTRNENEVLHITAGGGLILDLFNTPTHSLIIETPSVQYYFIAHY